MRAGDGAGKRGRERGGRRGKRERGLRVGRTSEKDLREENCVTLKPSLSYKRGHVLKRSVPPKKSGGRVGEGGEEEREVLQW